MRLYGHVAEALVVCSTLNWRQNPYPEGYAPAAGQVAVAGYAWAMVCAARTSCSTLRRARRASDSVWAFVVVRETTVLVLSRKFSIMNETIDITSTTTVSS